MQPWGINKTTCSKELKIIRDQFTITTWLLIGAVLHGLLGFILPTHYALLPAVLTLSLRSIHTLLQHYGLIENRAAEGVIRGKFSAQIPDREGNVPSQPAEHEVVVLHLATRSNQYGFLTLDRLFRIIANTDIQPSGPLGSWLPTGIQAHARTPRRPGSELTREWL